MEYPAAHQYNLECAATAQHRFNNSLEWELVALGMLMVTGG